MNLSLGEVEALCRKAARGAGFSWGTADDAGRAARWMAAYGVDGLHSFTVHLENAQTTEAPRIDSSDWRCTSTLCPLLTGAALLDHADVVMGAKSVTLHNLSHPILTLPFIDDIARELGVQANLASLDFNATLGGSLPKLQGQPDIPTPLTLICTITDTPTQIPTPLHTRANLPTALYQRLAALAHKTYAPATDASRLAGAGAGLTDKD